MRRYIRTVGGVKGGCNAADVASGHIGRVQGMSASLLRARFAPMTE